MPIDLAANRGNTASIEIEYAGERCRVTYLPEAMTVYWSTQLQKAQDAQDFEEGYSLLIEVISDWEIYDNGEKLPIDADSVMLLPISLLSIIAEAFIKNAMGRGKTSPAPIPKGSMLEKLFGALEDSGSRSSGPANSKGEK